MVKFLSEPSLSNQCMKREAAWHNKSEFMLATSRIWTTWDAINSVLRTRTRPFLFQQKSIAHEKNV